MRSRRMRPLSWSISYLLRVPRGISMRTSNSTGSYLSLTPSRCTAAPALPSCPPAVRANRLRATAPRPTRTMTSPPSVAYVPVRDRVAPERPAPAGGHRSGRLGRLRFGDRASLVLAVVCVLVVLSGAVLVWQLPSRAHDESNGSGDAAAG